MKIIFLLFAVHEIAAQGNMCGMPEPDPMKTCISLRLPWQVEPIHFCMGKDKFRYKNQCTSGHMRNCGLEMMRTDTLLLATPWDCCPYSSIPDHCMNQHCPPPPMNRQCQIIDNTNNGGFGSYSNFDCCAKYFCEENSSPEHCHMKRLDPMCHNPPKDKMNCVAFYDPYGCCTKYQCDGEGKPGMCPMQMQAMQMMMRYNASMMMGQDQMMGQGQMMGSGNGGPVMRSKYSKDDDKAKKNGRGGRGSRQAPSMSMGPPGSMMGMGSMDCIGDMGCGGTMKCCSQDMSVYYPMHPPGQMQQAMHGYIPMRNMNPTHGYCMEPASM